VPRALSADGAPGAPGADERARIKDALAAGTLPLFDFGGLFVQVEAADDALLYQIYSRQFPLDDRRVVVIEDKPKDGAFGEIGRLWVLSATGWRAWPEAALGADERDLLLRVGDSIRLQVAHTIDYRHALANPSSSDERRRGRDLSRALARDVPIARDLAATLLDTAERLSAGQGTGTTTATPAAEAPPTASALPARGAPAN